MNELTGLVGDFVTKNDIKIRNTINILRLLLKKEYSRVELASVLGLSKAGISGIISDLLEQKLIVETGRGVSRETGGKKPIFLSINKDAFTIMAIHFDHKRCLLALSDFLGNPIQWKWFPIIIHDDYTKTFDHILENVQEFLQIHKDFLDTTRILACGISLKGLVDSDSGILRFTAANKNWTNIPIKDYFSRVLDMEIFVDNDARSIMCLDLFSSQQNKPDDVNACMCIEEGLGSSVTIGNRIIRGAYSCAVNYAHSLIDPNGPVCICGKRGCVEAHCSIDALIRKSQNLTGDASLTYEKIVQLYHENDPVLSQLIKDDFCKWIGIAMGNFTQIFNPSILTVYLDQQLLDEPLRQLVMQHYKENLNAIASQCVVKFRQNGKELHLRAAAALVLNNYLSTTYHSTLGRR